MDYLNILLPEAHIYSSSVMPSIILLEQTRNLWMNFSQLTRLSMLTSVVESSRSSTKVTWRLNSCRL